MNNKSIIGKFGEDLACIYLENKGYKIVERNFRRPWGELDIVAKDKSGVLVFVEVKTIRSGGDSGRNSDILPEDNMNSAKIIKTKKIAETYANIHPELIDDNRGWRIDLVAIIINSPSGELSGSAIDYLTVLKKYCEIKHFENVE